MEVAKGYNKSGGARDDKRVGERVAEDAMGEGMIKKS